jgi:hypothetical protein
MLFLFLFFPQKLLAVCFLASCTSFPCIRCCPPPKNHKPRRFFFKKFKFIYLFIYLIPGGLSSKTLTAKISFPSPGATIMLLVRPPRVRSHLVHLFIRNNQTSLFTMPLNG